MNINNWKRLYALASEIESLEPWEWMSEDDIFGVHDPGSDITGYISVMGKHDEHYAVTAYRGAQAVIDLNKLIEGPQPMPEDLFLEIPQLMLSFESRELLDKRDLDLIKALGLKFRGENAWPLFRSYKPGFFPYSLDDEEQRSLIVYLEQAIHVLERTKADQEILAHADDPNGEKFLVRRAFKDKGNLWKDHYEEIQVESIEEFDFDFDQEMLINYQQRSSGILTYELDFFMLKTPVSEGSSPPFFPYALLLLETSSENIIGMEILDPLSGFDEMLAKIPSKVLSMLTDQPSKPKEIHVQSDRLMPFLLKMTINSGIKVELKPVLKVLNMARKELERYMK